MAQVNSKVLVIGASGFLGRHVARALLADGRTVRGMARTTARAQDLADAGCEVVQGDVLDAAAVERAVRSVDAVYVCVHTLSPQGASAAGRSFMDVEETGLRTIVAACQAHGARRLVYVTSIGTSPDAPSEWLRGRWRSEQFLFRSGLDVSVIRPGMIVGRGGTGFDAIVGGARRPVAIGLGSGRQRMRTVAVEDLAYYLVGVLDDPRSFGGVYDVGSDDVLTTDQMTDVVAERLGRRRPIKVHVPQPLLGLLAPVVERAGRMPRGSFRGMVDSLPVDMSGDPRPIRALLDRPARSYSQAVDRALEGSASAS